MPHYDYQCPECKQKWEIYRRVEERDDPTLQCPSCQAFLTRKFAVPMADVIWGGRWHDPWARKSNYDDLGPED